jgi:hypothetical protein
MHYIFATNVHLDENENEKYIYIILFNGIPNYVEM